MVSYHRPKSGHITCYLNRTYHVLLTLMKIHGSAISTAVTVPSLLWRAAPETRTILIGLHHAVPEPKAVRYAAEEFCRQLKKAYGNLSQEMERAVEQKRKVKRTFFQQSES